MEIGRYRVTGKLGTGAMGEVLRARDEKLGRDVAIKRVKNVLGIVAHTFKDRFEAEARALAALAHPGVVQVYDLGLEGDEPYLVMELVEGPTLKAVVTERGALTHQEVCALGIQLARALEAAHARGILHRDIKPGNVLRGAGGLWKLADFGVAHMPDSEVTISGQFLGTPAYAAPEALTLGQFSPASDVYGLAATLYEAATGAKPHGDATMADLIKTAHKPVIDPHSIPPSLGVLGPILAAGLAVSPDARPSATQMAELLAGSGSTETRTAAAAVATAAETIAPAPAVAALLSTLPARLPRWVFVVAAIVILIGLLALADRLGGSGSSAPGPGFLPSVGPARGSPQGPRSFSPPRNLDGRGAKDWRKVAEKVHEGDYAEALHKLYQFEDRHGASSESAALRGWLESQPATRFHDDD
ncbi:MAG TPA: serine/threonine-protein kinase [Kofleriaceae bacterium]|nr:serine/threonine-protein kinase [Kofleriaceae bacterium]